MTPYRVAACREPENDTLLRVTACREPENDTLLRVAACREPETYAALTTNRAISTTKREVA